MKIARPLFSFSAAALLFTAAHSFAVPSIVLPGVAVSDITPDGLTILGSVYEADLEDSVIYKFTLGSPAFRTGAVSEGSRPRFSNDAAVVAYSDYNYENLGNLSYGQPDWYNRTALSHKWTLPTGRVNLGVAPNGSRCDFTINSPYDISGNGQFIVGLQYSGGTCLNPRAFRVNLNTTPLSWSTLPATIAPPPANSPSRATRANGVSADGNTVCGFDENWNSTLTFQTRRACVWVRNAANTGWDPTIILDPDGGEAYVISDNGLVVAGVDDNGAACKWVRSGSTWTKTIIPGATGFPTALSADGSTIVGEQWIWKPSLNAGVAVNLSTHFTDLGGSFDGLVIGSPAGASVIGVSDDGNAIIVKALDLRSSCLDTFTNAILYLNGVPCEQPRIVFSPVSRTLSNVPTGFGVILNCFASGSWPLNYQWQVEDGNNPGTWINLFDDNCESHSELFFDYHGVTTSQLRLGSRTGNKTARYRCVVSNSCGSATSNVSNIVFDAPPANDSCLTPLAVGLGTTPVNLNTASLPQDGFSACAASVADLWYSFTPDFSANVKINTDCVGSPQTVLDIFASCADSLSDPVNALACNNDGPMCNKGSIVDNFPVVSGATYLIRVAREGAFNYQAPATALTITRIRPPCPGDFNADFNVEVADIFSFLNAWFSQFGSCASDCSADIDTMGGVQVADIFAFLNQWFSQFGQPCPF